MRGLDGPVKNVNWAYSSKPIVTPKNLLFAARPNKYAKILRSIGADKIDGSITVAQGVLRVMLTHSGSNLYVMEKGYMFGVRSWSDPKCKYEVLTDGWSFYRCTLYIDLP